MTTVAIMQPYFYPYAGYFRLFARADLFVIYDCVQFPRRGWVHRNRLTAADGTLQWLTLRLAYAPQETSICSIRLDPRAMEQLATDLRRFPAVDPGPAGALSGLPLLAGGTDLVDYLADNLRAVLDRLGIRCPMQRSSALGIDPALRGQERILEIASRVGASCYLNAPGGRDLYDAASFEARGMELAFLPPATGVATSMLERLGREAPSSIADEIRRDADALS